MLSGIMIAHREGDVFNCFGKVNNAGGRAVGLMCLLGRLAPARGRQLGPGLSCSGSCWGWVAQRLGGGEVFLDAYPSPAQDLTALLCSVPCAVGRKQFMRFEWASHAAEALGCEYEELNTATFKHHLRQIIAQVTSGPSRRSLEDEEAGSGTIPRPPWVGWVPAEPPSGDTPASFHYSSRIY